MAGRSIVGSLSISIQLQLFVDEPKLADHLKTADFFDVEKFPKAKFISTKIVPDEKGGDAYMVTGDSGASWNHKIDHIPGNDLRE